jgi:hypothetical protein
MTEITRNDVETPQYIGLVHELEQAHTPANTNLTHYYVYGVGESEILIDSIDITIDDESIDISDYYIFDGLIELFVTTQDDELVLTNTAPENFTYSSPPTQEYEVAIDTPWDSEYIKIDGDWYVNTEAGMAYMQHRRDNLTPSGSPPEDANRYTVTLYDPDSGGGTFWASCNGSPRSGDMPEEALTHVLSSEIEHR